MTFTKLTLAALVLGASLTPALAESGDLSQTPVAAYEQALGNPAAKPAVIEGRQAAPVVTPTAETGAARYLDGRVQDQDR
ncbi:hypothetical protein [Pinisolibacter aquiterrae]|uniref:hypothetical protein n=1 Tax=Pinisolibacter aquiterrae TaxID=2815579 RepID=UPI001C3DE126|nr:hypothetical protein [Pinisolibacter aquiterrae]MBV5264994.1 hypothetical protein [Pinisolibacter aquiterrae]MCC8235624.1 hypothetical protein [Pinisolibacter aquiterrae]